MQTVLTIGWKDLRVLFSDRAALILMLAAPLLLAAGLGLVSGALFGGDNNGMAGLGDIPLVIHNGDAGELGDALTAVFSSPDLQGVFAVETAVAPAAARQAVREDAAAAALIIPPGFSASLLPDPATGRPGPAAPLQIVTNPGRPISAGVVQAVAGSALNDLETGVIGLRVALAQQIAAGQLDPAQAAEAGQTLGRNRALAQGEPLLRVNSHSPGAAPAEPNLLAVLAPGMAVFFLMFTVTQGAGSLLAERDAGTLGRMLSNPVTARQILGGKVSGIFFSGTAQMSILILATALLFGVRWGDPAAVALLILTVVAAASGWGLLLAAAVSTTQQVGSIGTAMMLIFGILGGSLVPVPDSGPLALIGKLTPNAWAADGFQTLALGGGTADLLPNYLALLLMAAILFTVAAALFRRRPLINL